MPHATLTLSHPIDELELYDLDPSTWRPLNPPELYLVDNTALVPLISTYMPHFLVPHVARRGPVETATDGRHYHFFKLNREVNPQWLQCFGKYRGAADVSFDRDQLVLLCRSEELQKLFEEVIYAQLYQATSDYREEREHLVWHVFEKMQRVGQRHRVEREILAAFNRYRREKTERIELARKNGLSVLTVIENYNREYREVLENKFAQSWEKSLDNAAIRRYRALFEQEFLLI
jgi:hypothetical protein